MYGLDTNILIRYLTKDDPKQSPQAVRFINRHCTQETPGFINCIVLCELVWVLESAYNYERSLISEVLNKILFTRQFKIENLPIVHRAVYAYSKDKIDFADYLISAINDDNNCKYTVSFDKKGIKSGIFHRI